jgi:tetratricopeptide (TPR) repeat protein
MTWLDRARAALICLPLFYVGVPQAVAEIDVMTSLSGPYLAGRTATRERDGEAAARYVAEALALDPSNPVLTERLFQIELANGNFAATTELARKVLSANSQHRMARLVIGLEELKAGKYDKARENFSEAGYTPIGELTSVMLNAWTYAGEGSVNAAMKELAKLESNESFANFRVFHEALIADLLSSNVRAAEAYRRANQQAGSSLRVALTYGNYLERKGKNEDAIKAYEAFLKSAGNNVLVQRALENAKSATRPAILVDTPIKGAGEALFSIASAMNDEESLDVALLYAQLADAAGFDPSIMKTLIGDIQLTSDNVEKAIAAYEQVPVSSPLRSNAEIQIALANNQIKQVDVAVARLKGLLAREPSNYEAWLMLGGVYRNNENYKEADEAYASAEKLVAKPDREHWQLFYYRGVANERLKNWPVAEENFRKALSLSPDEPSVLNYLGYSLIDTRQKLDEAFTMVKKAVELRPNDGYIVDSLGWGYYQIAEFEKAVEFLERAVNLRPADPIINEHLGDAYWRVGRTLEAKFQWQHARDNDPEPSDLMRIEKKIREGLVEPAPQKPTTAEQKKSNNG